MSGGREEIWAVVPVKETADAKQRLAGVLPPAVRRELALAMVEDVLATLGAVRDFAGIAVVTVDADVGRLAATYGANVWTDGARDGHSGAVAAAARRLGRQGFGMLTLPADVPLAQPADIEAVLGAQSARPRFVIVPARDRRGSNAVLCAPADAVPLRFGDDSFLPHLAAAQACGIAPLVLQRPRLALDLDRPDDLAEFLRAPATTRAHAVLARHRAAPSMEPAR
jgi:2-phospho-L-lactate guanylyltransferase